MVRIPISITLPPKRVEWLDKKVESGIYANYSHAIGVVFLRNMKKEKKE